MAHTQDSKNSSTTIGVLGIGGVGGFFGGLLAKKYAGSTSIKIVFMTKAETAAVINKNGLTLIQGDEESTISPYLTISEAKDVPTLDYLICCTKTYNLEKALDDFKPAISKNTIIIPLQNGVNARHIIQNKFPKNPVTDGCVYLVSKIMGPGVIEQNGDVHSLYFGSSTIPEIELKKLESILQEAKIDGHYSTIIEAIIWEKFIFISSLASATTFLNKKVGEIRKSKSDNDFLTQLVDESMNVAIGAGIKISANTYEKSLKKIKEMSEDSTTSMQRDFQNHQKTEYKSLTEYVVQLGKKYQIETPGFEKVLKWFQSQDRNSQLAN